MRCVTLHCMAILCFARRRTVQAKSHASVRVYFAAANSTIFPALPNRESLCRVQNGPFLFTRICGAKSPSCSPSRGVAHANFAGMLLSCQVHNGCNLGWGITPPSRHWSMAYKVIPLQRSPSWLFPDIWTWNCRHILQLSNAFNCLWRFLTGNSGSR